MSNSHHNRNNNMSDDNMCGRDWQDNDIECDMDEQRHVHELLGSTEIADRLEPHNHRFATVTGEAIGQGMNHYHEVRFRTDFFEDHFHVFCGRTTNAIQVGDRHVHFLESVTSESDGHVHRFRAATLIDNPIGDDC